MSEIYVLCNKWNQFYEGQGLYGAEFSFDYKRALKFCSFKDIKQVFESFGIKNPEGWKIIKLSIRYALGPEYNLLELKGRKEPVLIELKELESQISDQEDGIPF